MFPTHVRYAGMAIACKVSTSLFCGTAPIVSDWLVDKTGNPLVPACYMMAACAVGAIALFFVIGTKGCSLRGHQVPDKERA
ncbi:sugar transport protein [Paraburkholderia unamae]|nr:sugar transport protein [Paraburkholderia unamae]